MSDTPSQADLAEVRSQGAWFLSRFYLERPDPAFLAEVAAALAAVPSGEELDRDVQLLQETLTTGQPPAGGFGPDPAALDGVAVRLAPEFTRLFRGIQAGYGPPPPYESLYRGGEPMGDWTLAVMRHYQRAGFADIHPEAGPPDHLATELRFLALLALREAEAHQAGDPEAAQGRIAQQAAFLDQHLLGWLPPLVQRIEAEAREAFYPSVARMTLAFAQEVRGQLGLAA